MQEFMESLKNYEFVIKYLALIVTILSGLFAFWKWRKDVGLKRSTKFQELVSKNRVDSEMLPWIYKLDDDEQKWLNENFFGSPAGTVLDKVLFHFCYEIYLYNHRYIKKEEFQPLSYEINRALLNPQLQEYLFNLQMYAKGKGIESPYKYLVKYGLKNGLLDSSFLKGCCETNEKVSKFHPYYKEWLTKERIFGEEKYPQLDSCNRKSRSWGARRKDLIKSYLYTLKW